MIRTERLAVTDDRSGMLAEVSDRSCGLRPEEVETYLALQSVARASEQPDTLEYWKAASYLLSFMDDYELKRAVTQVARRGGDKSAAIAAALTGSHLALPWKDVVAYQPLDPGNVRLRSLAQDTLEKGMWQLLWLPAALPYYRPGGVFAEVPPEGLTKRLVFSSWLVVPKVIAGVLSYEAERRMITSLEAEAQNTPEARKRRRGLLRFAREADGLRLAGMPVLGLLYPSLALVDELDPLALAHELGANGGVPELDVVLEKATEKSQELLQRVLDDLGPRADLSPSGPVDENWYWAAPILIDMLRHRGEVRTWLQDEETAADWAGEEADTGDEEDGESLWDQHVAKAAELADGGVRLGRPPDDLAHVVALLGTAGPAVAAARSLARMVEGSGAVGSQELRDAAGAVAWAFRNLFNLPETMAVVRGRDAREPYWRRALEYCAAGCLQAVLDEYAHVLKEFLGLIDKSPEETVEGIGEEMQRAMSLRTAGLNVDVLEAEEGRVRVEKQRMRARFALGFGQEQSDEGEAVNRAEQVRSAFNSPFWPFVLATTSVGQEGLDFHPYCHAVVHWNLPSNPVDLEQREGRVHRYKGHAVRKNLATTYGVSAAGPDGGDPWAALFARAAAERGEQSDMTPFWVFQVPGGARIERHVPALPLSRDSDRLERLRKSLAAYRMVFGQARQEELLSYLLSHFPAEQTARLADDLRIDLSPPRGS